MKVRPCFVMFFLCLIVFLLYFQVVSFSFIDYDDNLYLLDNYPLQEGLNLRTIRWAFVDFHTGHWHPLTWLSHLLDWSLFGGWAGGHHLINVLFHLADISLLFLFLVRFTGEWGKSFFVAALFALHPVNVESVAWVAERKNVLSTFFWFLSLLAYGSYVQRPSRARYVFSLLCFALGLMAKPMLVTMPFLLLLLDFWPLKRWDNFSLRTIGKKIGELWPFFFFSFLSTLITLYAAQVGGSLRSLEQVPLSLRVENALFTYLWYIGKLLFPINLAVFYPLPSSYPLWQVFGASVLFVFFSFSALRLMKSRPYIFVGWVWYLTTLLPVIGLVQVGYQAAADRYLYVPAMGIFLVMVWGACDLLCFFRGGYGATSVAVVIITLLLPLSYRQVTLWQNSLTLFSHDLQCTKENPIAHLALGTYLLRKGENLPAAKEHFLAVLRIKPDDYAACNNLGVIFLKENDKVKARDCFLRALSLYPRFVKVYNNLGVTALAEGKKSEAIGWFKGALAVDPHYLPARRNLHVLLGHEP